MTDEKALAAAKARLSIAAIKARNSINNIEKIEVYANDIAILLAAHSDLDRQSSNLLSGVPFCYMIEERGTETTILKDPDYLPPANDKRKVTPLYLYPKTGGLIVTKARLTKDQPHDA